MAILSFHRDKLVHYKYPNGYWYASAEDLGYDGDGLTPLDALMDLANVLEEALKTEENRREKMKGIADEEKTIGDVYE